MSIDIYKPVGAKLGHSSYSFCVDACATVPFTWLFVILLLVRHQDFIFVYSMHF